MAPRVMLAAAWSVVALPALADEAAVWEGWIVGAPCAAELRVADCPLRHIDNPVLLTDSGEKLAFAFGDGTPVSETDVDEAYGKKVRLTGAPAKGRIRPARMDLLEKSGAQKFFKGCL